MIDHWIHVVTGKHQTRATRTGMHELWFELRDMSSAGTCVQVDSWNENWADMAEFLNAYTTDAPVIDLIGYSFGGDAACDFAGHLDRLGLAVRNLYLVDAVYRNDFFPSYIPAEFTSLLPTSKLHIPGNVAQVEWWYQRNALPMGHEPVKKPGSATKISPGTKLDRLHSQMDDVKEIHQAFLRAVA